MQAAVAIAVIVGLFALASPYTTGVNASDLKKAEEDRDAFQLLQLRLFSEITNFADTWAAETPKCQSLAQYTRYSMDRFFAQTDHPERYREHDEAAVKNAEKLAKELGCEKDNANLWKRFHGLLQVFDANNKQLNKVIQRLQEGDKQLREEQAKSATKTTTTSTDL